MESRMVLRPRDTTHKAITVSARNQHGCLPAHKKFTPLTVQRDELTVSRPRLQTSRSPITRVGLSPRRRKLQSRRFGSPSPTGSQRRKRTSSSPNPISNPVPNNEQPTDLSGIGGVSPCPSDISKSLLGRMNVSLPQNESLDLTGGVNFFPSLGWGEKEIVEKSKIQRADRDMEIWEEVRRSHIENLPCALPFIDGELEKAKAVRAGLTDCEENHRVGAPNAGAAAIQKQIEALEWALAKSKFEPEGENIRAAIAGYKSGDIGFNKHFTILYAGKIVDTAPTYASFTVDRLERLDKYCKAHGPHWIFWEAPLDVHPESKPMAMMSTANLASEEGWSSLGPYFVQQGFWKRSGWVMRCSDPDEGPHEKNLRRLWVPPCPLLAEGTTLHYCQNDGPKVAFRSLLDSGATYPTLYTLDLQKLNMDEKVYACQGITNVSTAAGIMRRRIYELHVCVLDEDNNQLVDKDNPSWPFTGQYLGGLCPVTEITEPISNEDGPEVTARLSGLLPFRACYVSSTPGLPHLFLGEDRGDVLGAFRMPGQMRWTMDARHAAGKLVTVKDPPANLATYGRPITTFEHRDGHLVDEDDPSNPHASVVSLHKGLPGEVRYRHCPAADQRLIKRVTREEECVEKMAGDPKWVTRHPGF